MVDQSIPSINVLGEPLELCCRDPMTGFYRDGFCNTGDSDAGVHTVCASVTQTFLERSAIAGNDLMTPRPQFNFPGLAEGDQWCLCAMRWQQAEAQGYAPRVYLRRTHLKTLDIIPLETLKAYALDLS